MKTLSAIIYVILLSSCVARQTTVNVISQPPGAFITEVATGKLSPERTPNTIFIYNIDASFPKDTSGCYLIKALEATWPSGATARTPDPIKLCGNPGEHFTVTIDRPVDEPGLETDRTFADSYAHSKYETSKKSPQATTDAPAANNALILLGAIADGVSQGLEQHNAEQRQRQIIREEINRANTLSLPIYKTDPFPKSWYVHTPNGSSLYCTQYYDGGTVQCN